MPYNTIKLEWQFDHQYLFNRTFNKVNWEHFRYIYDTHIHPVHMFVVYNGVSNFFFQFRLLITQENFL